MWRLACFTLLLVLASSEGRFVKKNSKNVSAKKMLVRLLESRLSGGADYYGSGSGDTNGFWDASGVWQNADSCTAETCFFCNDAANTVIPTYWVCDVYVDCPGGEDEEGCSSGSGSGSGSGYWPGPGDLYGSWYDYGSTPGSGFDYSSGYYINDYYHDIFGSGYGYDYGSTPGFGYDYGSASGSGYDYGSASGSGYDYGSAFGSGYDYGSASGSGSGDYMKSNAIRISTRKSAYEAMKEALAEKKIAKMQKLKKIAKMEELKVLMKTLGR